MRCTKFLLLLISLAFAPQLKVELEDLFWGNLPDKKKFQLTCTNILENIRRVRAIPFDKRKFDF